MEVVVPRGGYRVTGGPSSCGAAAPGEMCARLFSRASRHASDFPKFPAACPCVRDPVCWCVDYFGARIRGGRVGFVDSLGDLLYAVRGALS